MKRIAIFGALPTSTNMGVQALAYSSYYIIEKALQELNIEGQISFRDDLSLHTILDYYERKIEVDVLPSYVGQGLRGLARRIKHWRGYNKALNVDIVFDITGGDSFTDIYGDERFNNMCLVKEHYKKHNVKYVLLPQTIGPFSSKNALRAKQIMQKCEFVFARDAQSMSKLKEYKIEKSKELIDVAFFLPFVKKDKFNIDKKIHVGLNISALLWNGGYTKDNQFGLSLDYKKTILELISYFLSQEEVVLHLITHVIGFSYDDVENDYSICKKIYEEYNSNRMRLAPMPYNPIEIKSYISRLDFFVGARMHATIASFSTGVPVVPMAYSRKFNGLFIDTLGHEYLADLKKDDQSKVINTIKRAFDYRDSIAKKQKSTIETLVEEKKQLIIESVKEILIEC